MASEERGPRTVETVDPVAANQVIVGRAEARQVIAARAEARQVTAALDPAHQVTHLVSLHCHAGSVRPRSLLWPIRARRFGLWSRTEQVLPGLDPSFSAKVVAACAQKATDGVAQATKPVYRGKPSILITRAGPSVRAGANEKMPP